MIASMHVADIGAKAGLLRAPKPDAVPGLRSARAGLCSVLGPSFFPALQFGRGALVAFWDDDVALDKFLADHPVAASLASGWHARLEPLRATGTWPGLPTDLTRNRKVDTEGPVVVITLARLKLGQAIRFFRTSARAEDRVMKSPGLVWATGFGKPPFLATCSLWESAEATVDYAYGDHAPEHPDAMDAHRAKPFHHESAFIRFRPYASQGGLDGKNPLPASWLAS